tara:strand:- start:24 stop:608 length:585 start_codon:yes stop_codon:yes gene_type:complete
MQYLYDGEFVEEAEPTEKQNFKEAFLAAYYSHKRANPKVELLEMDREQHIMAVRAKMPEPFKSYHLDDIRTLKLACSRAKLLSNELILGEGYDAERVRTWSVKSARNWLDERDVKIPAEYQRFLDSPEWYNFARGLKEKHNWTCQMCELYCLKNTLHAHHVKPDVELRLTESNIWIVCRSCHGIIHFERDTKKE